ncbi:MAG: hypothetical protein ABI742_13290, partial [Gemmatimonadota bacterium]
VWPAHPPGSSWPPVFGPDMTHLSSWMPIHDAAARYSIRISAPPTQVYATLLATDFSRSLVVRGLMGIRLLPGLLRTPTTTWRRLTGHPRTRASLRDLADSDFILLQESPPHEIVLGITGRFWKLAAEVVRIPPERFRDALPEGLAQAVWNFELTDVEGGTELATETRIRCADPATRRQFLRYWRFVSPGSGLIRHAILAQVRREATAKTG